MRKLEDILKEAEESSRRPWRVRFKPESWTMEMMLNAVIRIGRTYDPRFVIDDDNRAVYTNLIYWINNDSRMQAVDPVSGKAIPGNLGKGIYLAGNVGTGKSVAMQIVRTLYQTNPFVHDSKEIKWNESRADIISEAYANDGALDIKKRGLLCIQDLGCEPYTQMHMGNRVNVLQNLLEYRGDHPELITMATSNFRFDGEDFKLIYGDRVQSRMNDMFNYLKLVGKDRRRQ